MFFVGERKRKQIGAFSTHVRHEIYGIFHLNKSKAPKEENRNNSLPFTAILPFFHLARVNQLIFKSRAFKNALKAKTIYANP